MRSARTPLIRVVFCAAIVFLYVGCSYFRKGVPSPPVEAKDPIIAMTMASSIDDKGRLVNPRFTFPQNEPQITAIVRVGKVTGATLSVTWYTTSDSGDQKLFEHQIPVKSHDRAFSVGKNAGGMLSAGTYKVAATLAGQTKDMEFDVSPPKMGGNKTSGSRTDKVFEDQARSKRSDHLFAAANDARALFAARAYGTIAGDEAQMLKVSGEALQAAPETPTGSPVPQGQPPVTGPSGTEPYPVSPGAHIGTSASGCYVLPEGDYPDEYPASYAATDSDVLDVSCRGECSAPPGEVNSIVVSATVNAPSKQIGKYAGDPHGALVDYYVDPCYLSGGSDLPGTKVVVTSSVMDTFSKEIGSVRATYTLADDSLAPRVKVTSTPNKGAKVKAGDKIEIKVTAQEKRRNDTWQTGVKVIQITADPGGLVKDPWVNPSNLPKPCGEKTWEQDYQATYLVPTNPPPIIKICALAGDYAGNQGAKCGEFPTAGGLVRHPRLVGSPGCAIGNPGLVRTCRHNPGRRRPRRAHRNAGRK